MAKREKDPELDVGSAGFVEEFCTKPYVDDDGVQVASGIGKDGKEYPDPVPMSPPVGYSAPPDLMQMIRTMVHSEMAQRVLTDAGWDTFEEAGDFDIEDDPLEPLSPWEAILQTPPQQGNRPQEAAPNVAPASAVTPSQTVAASAEAGVASPPPGNSPPSNSTST